MANPFIGEINIFAGNFCPRGYGFCQGALVDISQNTALFAIIGTIYGGDGRVSMGLPDLQGRSPLHVGGQQNVAGPGLYPYSVGQEGGFTSVGLNVLQIPSHSHSFSPARQSKVADQVATPAGNYRGRKPAIYSSHNDKLVNMASESIGFAGGSAAHENRQPYTAIDYIIAMDGVFPPRN